MKENIVEIGKNLIGGNNPTYFIADIAANWDESLERAKDLIFLAAEAGADAAKFQNFEADTIISAESFNNMQGKLSHQASWDDSVYNRDNITWECICTNSRLFIFYSICSDFMSLYFQCKKP